LVTEKINKKLRNFSKVETKCKKYLNAKQIYFDEKRKNRDRN
jgi:hypothetical protein